MDKKNTYLKNQLTEKEADEIAERWCEAHESGDLMTLGETLAYAAARRYIIDGKFTEGVPKQFVIANRDNHYLITTKDNSIVKARLIEIIKP